MRLLCIIGRNVFSVNIRGEQSVHELKVVIRDENAQALATIDATKLALYRIDVPLSDDEDKNQEILKEISLGVHKFKFKKMLRAWDEVSQTFDESELPKGTLHVLVELPAEYPSRGPKLLANPEMCMYNDKTAVEVLIGDVINTLRPKIRDFLNKPRLPTWLPPAGSVDGETLRFYGSLKVPLVNGKPSILLHDLCRSANSNADNLFQAQKHRILCNVSGAGKTRLLLEGLSRRWGFYFVTAQGSDGIGAPDLEAAIALMSRSTGWTPDIFRGCDSEGVQSADSVNRAIAFRQISKVLLARWIVFKTFIDVADQLRREGVSHDNIQQDWLLFQILPLVSINDMNPFLALISLALSCVHSEVLEALRASLNPSNVLGPSFKDSFFYVIDEAQVAGRQYMGAFADQECINKRPVLRPIIQCMMGPAHASFIKVIISGTGFSLGLFEELMASGVGKDSQASEFDVVHGTGDFSEPDTQLNYISRYLPPPFLASESGTHLKARVYGWLRGRHRFTVRFLEELMRGYWHKDRPISPHKLLNAYVQRLADFTPLDGDKMILREEKDVGPVEIDTFQWNKIQRDPKRLEELAYTIYSFTTRGITPMWWDEQQPLVEYGLARFVHVGNEKAKVTIEEPLALISVMRYFESNSRSIGSHIRRRLQDDQGIALEEAVLWAMTNLLQGQRDLAEIFEFYHQSPSWADCTAQIVARSSSGDYEAFAFDKPVNPCSIFAFHAEGAGDVERWLESGESCWCIPGTLMGPDLMTRLRLSDGRLLLLVIQAKCRSAGNIDTVSADVSASAIRSLIPGEFFHSSRKEDWVNKARQLEVDHGIDSMLGAINQGNNFPGQKYNILRVVAAFPLDIDFKSSSKAVQDALREDTHPLAKLPRAVLTAELATCQDGRSFVNQLNGTLKRARAQRDEGSEDRPKAKRRGGVEQPV